MEICGSVRVLRKNLFAGWCIADVVGDLIVADFVVYLDLVTKDRKESELESLRELLSTVFAEINAHPEISAHQKQWFFKGGSTQNRWALMGDFSKGGVHKTDEFWWVIFQRGEYTKPMDSDGVWNVFLLLLQI